MSTPKYLYHYTSLETLALILENRSICFNSLLNVDDIEEAQASDIDNFGKYVYVSCWTDEKKESIPLWNLYTPNMHGVRIRMPLFPFVKYQYKKGEFDCAHDFESYIDYKQVYEDNKGTVTPNMPLLEPITYTNEKEKLTPVVRIQGTAEDAQRFISGKYDRVEIAYSLKELGRNKNTDWKFQKEWRYILWFSPIKMSEYKNDALEQQKALIQRMENPDQEPPYQRFFLKLREDAIKQMEVVFGPRMSDAEKILAKALLKTHGLDGHWKDSSLKIR